MGNYATVEDIRDEGVSTDDASDTVIEETIDQCEFDFERYCNRWFYKRDSYTWIIDAGEHFTFDPNLSGFRGILELPVPIINLVSITINDQLKNLDDFVVYDRIGAPRDDRFDPKIISKNCEWPSDGLQNIVLNGSFGFVNPAPDYKTPIEIKRAVRKLVILNLPFYMQMTDVDRHLFMNQHRIYEERTAGYSYRMRNPTKDPNQNEVIGFTGDEEIDNIIEKYRYKAFSRSV